MSGPTTHERLESAGQDLHNLTDRVWGLPQESQRAVSEVLDELETALGELQGLEGALVRPSEDSESTLSMLRSEETTASSCGPISPSPLLMRLAGNRG